MIYCMYFHCFWVFWLDLFCKRFSYLVSGTVFSAGFSCLCSHLPSNVFHQQHFLFSCLKVDQMMKTAKENASSPTPRHDVACDWLKENSARWLTWIPSPTKCKVGFGLYNEVFWWNRETNLNRQNVQSFQCLSIGICGNLSYPEASGEFSTSRAQATTCRACLPGMYSIPLDDGEATYMCKPCPEGTQQLGAGAVVCDPCPVGTSKAEVSTAECQPCASGFYQDEHGKARWNCSTPSVFFFSSCFHTLGGMPPDPERRHASNAQMALRLCFSGFEMHLVVAANKEPLMSQPARQHQRIVKVAVMACSALTCPPKKLCNPEPARMATGMSPSFCWDAGWWFQAFFASPLLDSFGKIILFDVHVQRLKQRILQHGVRPLVSVQVWQWKTMSWWSARNLWWWSWRDSLWWVPSGVILGESPMRWL